MNTPDNTKQSGFTLIETLIALFILVLAVSAPLSLAYQSIQSSRTTTGNVLAFYLAQEALEYIKNWRNDNVNQTPPKQWDDGISTVCASFCDIDITKPNYPSAVNQCTPGNNHNSCGYLQYDAASNLYEVQNGVSENELKRSVQWNAINGYEAVVTVLVTWTVNGVDYEYELSERMYDTGTVAAEQIPICGNRKCELWEDYTSCQADCAGTGAGDTDGDLIQDVGDNCWCVSNPLQQDTDGDRVGDMCDWDIIERPPGGPIPPEACCDSACGQ
jgi:prepilin-type N-terminal cleavage/methylation domain-containing protein